MNRQTLQDKPYHESLQQKTTETRVGFLERLAVNLPGGYHRCGVGEGFPLEFVSDSFVDTVGWTKEELKNELDNKFINIVAREDRERFMGLEPALVRDGYINVAYRIRRKDGSLRWVQDSTQRVKTDNDEYYQCVLVDITNFVNQQEKMALENMELVRSNTMKEIMEENMPGGYHRCMAKEGCPFVYIGNHFTDIVGFTKEEIQQDFDNLYVNLLWDDDKKAILTYEKMLEMQGKGNAYDTSIYRVKHKDGGYRWVSDSTMFVDIGADSFFQSTISDITEYINALNDAKEEAEASNQAKSVFLFNASHDIRTPMNAIQGFAHIIKENADNPQVVTDAVEKIIKSGDTLMLLINDILELARIERGKDEINATEISLYDHGKNLYEMFASEMEEKGIDFTIEMDVKHENIFCDNIKMTRIGMNMLSNARKFTPPGGKVVFGVKELSCSEDTALYRFYTRDTGIGMSKEFLEKAFDQFERERTSTDSGVTGSGLGLAIIKKLVNLMGGSYEIESRQGKGTEISVTVQFPLVKNKSFITDEASATEIDFSGKRVLLVEDNEFNREIAGYILSGLNINVEEAENGAVCVRKILNSNPGYYDLVLMDIQMPVMDGYTATKEIRRIGNKVKASVPIIAMTANAFDEDKKRCIDVGMNGHIGKPIQRENLVEELSKILHR